MVGGRGCRWCSHSSMGSYPDRQHHSAAETDLCPDSTSSGNQDAGPGCRSRMQVRHLPVHSFCSAKDGKVQEERDHPKCLHKFSALRTRNHLVTPQSAGSPPPLQGVLGRTLMALYHTGVEFLSAAASYNPRYTHISYSPLVEISGGGVHM